MRFVRNLFRKRRPTAAARDGAANPLAERISRSWAAHRDELVDLPSPRRRAEILATWREIIDREAHDYADLVLVHPKREQIMELEADAITQAYLCGIMAQRGWVERIEAEQAAFMLGRALRDRLRGLEFPLDSVNPALGVVINEALGSIVELGVEESD
jgi:hypothetical protein